MRAAIQRMVRARAPYRPEPNKSDYSSVPAHSAEPAAEHRPNAALVGTREPAGVAWGWLRSAGSPPHRLHLQTTKVAESSIRFPSSFVELLHPGPDAQMLRQPVKQRLPRALSARMRQKALTVQTARNGCPFLDQSRPRNLAVEFLSWQQTGAP